MSGARSLMRHTDRTWLGGSKTPSGPGTFLYAPHPPHGSPSYTFPMASQKIDSNSTSVEVTDSSTENTLADMSIPALTLANEGVTRLTATGTILNSTNTGATISFRVKLDTTTVMETSGISCSTSVNPRKWALEVLTLGNATNVQTHWGTLGVSDPSTHLMADTTWVGAGSSTSGESELAALGVTVTTLMSQASTSLTVTQTGAVLEAVV